MAPITPFKISVPEDDISKLHQRLALTSLPPEVSFSSDWAYGAPLSDISRLLDYWRNGFDWKKQEARLNAILPQFTTTVNIEKFGSIGIHFVHQRSERADAIPLLFVHGWPGSFIEVSKILPLLTNPPKGKQAFHVVAPSLPNYGFSDRIQSPNFSIAQYVETVHQVMLAAGYAQYVTQGGDWGAHITRVLAHLHPEASLAHHVNMVPLLPQASFFTAPFAYLRELFSYHFSSTHQADQKQTALFAKEGRGYNLLQSTKPHTLSFSLSDSPVGLLAWIYEKLHGWTDSYPWTDDEILTWISIYWFSKAGPAAPVRIYYEINHTDYSTYMRRMEWTASPVGLSYFPKELSLAPEVQAPRVGNVVFKRKHDKGGHFAAYEVPEALVEDLRDMFGQGALSVAKKLAAKK